MDSAQTTNNLLGEWESTTGSRLSRDENPLKEPTGNWLQTFTGEKFYPLDPRPEMVHLEDIAHALSNQCRFAGHIRDFYSVAQHSVLVSLICDRADRLWGLLHDAPEAYICDLPRPVKYEPRMAVYKEVEKKLEAAIVSRFGLSPITEPPSVKAADRRLLFTERRDLFDVSLGKTKEWGMGLEGEPLPVKIIPWTPQHAEKMFIKRYEELTK